MDDIDEALHLADMLDDDIGRAIWLADRAGLKPSPERLAWIAACLEALRAAREDGAVEAHRLWQSGALPAITGAHVV